MQKIGLFVLLLLCESFIQASQNDSAQYVEQVFNESKTPVILGQVQKLDSEEPITVSKEVLIDNVAHSESPIPQDPKKIENQNDDTCSQDAISRSVSQHVGFAHYHFVNGKYRRGIWVYGKFYPLYPQSTSKKSSSLSSSQAQPSTTSRSLKMSGARRSRSQ